MTFQLVRVPVTELIESVIAEAAAAKRLPADEYLNWRKVGAPEAPLLALFEKIDRARPLPPGVGI